MTISTVDPGYVAAIKQWPVTLAKTASRTATAFGFYSVFDLAGSPGAGTLSAGNTTNGVVGTDTGGYPAINDFASGGLGYLTRARATCTVPCNLWVYDRVFKAGAYAFNASQVLASQPSYATRVPSLDFKGLQLWFEAVTAFTGTPTVQVTYTNESGIAAHTTGAVSLGVAPILGQCFQLPFQSGDNGVQKVEQVVGTVASAGTFNINVLRPLWFGRIDVANDATVEDLLATGMPQLFQDSALFLLVQPDSTSTGLPTVMIEVANG